MKICNCCNKAKKTFHKDSSKKDGLRTICKDCDKERLQTVHGCIVEMFKRMKRNSKARKHDLPHFNKLEFKNWLLFKTDFYTLYKDWKNSDFHKDKVPSVDRIDDYKPYSFDNIRLVTWKENNTKAYKDRKEGINNKNNTVVLKFSDDMQLINCYYSLAFAASENNTHRSCIRRCCKNKNAKSNGFYWRYLEDKNGTCLKVGDDIRLDFPFTPTVCKIIKVERNGVTQIIPNSPFQAIYGENWSRFCEKI